MKYFKTFLHRGLMFAGFGPLIAGIICLFSPPMSGRQVFLAIISTYLLAFVHAGASVFNQIEEWPVAKSLLCHFGALYLAYTLCYLVNTWIPFEPKVLLIFTLIFAAVYFVIWITVFISVKAVSRKLNSKLEKAGQ